MTVPTMYVWSTEDAAPRSRGGGRRPRHTAEGPYRFEVLEGVSHWIPEEAPEVLDTLLPWSTSPARGSSATSETRASDALRAGTDDAVGLETSDLVVGAPEDAGEHVAVVLAEHRRGGVQPAGDAREPERVAREPGNEPSEEWSTSS